MTGEAAPPAPTRPPAILPPEGACDCHGHVFGPAEKFHFAFTPAYTPPAATIAQHASMRAALGIARAVLVQPTPYGTDASALLDALAAGEGRLRGIAAATPAIADETLLAWSSSGVTGLRFVETRAGDGAPLPGAVSIDDAEQLASRMAAIGWHAELWASLDRVLAVAPRLQKLGVPVVLDHMGGFDARAGTAAPSFERLLGLVRDGIFWIKLSLCRRVAPGCPLASLRPFHDALIGANPGIMLWGSDWPFVRMGEAAPNAGDLLTTFCAWVDDSALRRRILVDNPARRYGFGAQP